ncbi:hypothetical protein FS749_008628 [Ceratobasidium sp. UAMH 11750]|nr:hypothetical protein FS749_008628 [Ceratobasidium sp. UAMH 11750]
MGINLLLYFKDKREDPYCVLHPRVVLEMTYSQSLSEAEDKAWEYLYGFDNHVHAVIICDMPRPIQPVKSFRARIAVWTRAKTGDDNLDYPFEETNEFPHELLEQVTQPPPPERKENTELTEAQDGSSSEESPSLMAVSGETTPIDIVTPQTRAGPGNDTRRIETPGYVVILDTDVDAGFKPPKSKEPFELDLNVYHFLRYCPRHRHEWIPDDDLALPLAPLRSYIVGTLEAERQRAQKRKAEAEGAVTTLPSTSQTAGAPMLWTSTPS